MLTVTLMGVEDRIKKETKNQDIVVMIERTRNKCQKATEWKKKSHNDNKKTRFKKGKKKNLEIMPE